MGKIKLIVVVGPTASGKSALAIRLARRFNGEIISADSRQVYRGMDIGTGKVKRDKWTVGSGQGLKADFYSEGIRHYLIDVASPRQQYSVVKFRRAAVKAIRDIVRRGKLPIICGGTGFWIDALVYDQSLPPVKPDAKLRSQLHRFTPSQLFSRLQKLDPERAAAIDRHNPVRLIRALEIVIKTGRPVPPRINGSPYEPFILGISIPKEKLTRRVAKRLDARLKHGMVSEVRRLHAQGLSFKRLESFGLEYRHLARYLQGKYGPPSSLGIRHSSFQAMRSALLGDIVGYSKRQLTWWRKNPGIVWVGSALDSERKIRHHHAV